MFRLPLQTNPEKSIAVLPFVNMSADPDNEYFSDGITEEIINALTSIQGLKVIARTSSFAFKNKHVDVRTIGRQLGVKSVLEGSVRIIKTRVRITAQLVNTTDGSHWWSKNFDRDLEDIFALQDDISLRIADQIRENFGHLDLQDHLVDSPTTNIEAYNLYLKGRFHQLKWNARDLIEAVKYYEQSIEQDPDFALPYFGAALSSAINASWGFISYGEGIQKADTFLQKGLALNDRGYLSYFAHGTVSLWGKWDFKSAHHYLLETVKRNPSFTDAEEGLAELYTAIGDFAQAMHHTRHILTLNPLSPNHYYTKGNIHFLQNDYLKALECMETALQIDPQYALAIEMIAVCYIRLKDYQKLDQFLRTYSSVEQPVACRALFKLLYPEVETGLDLETIRTDFMDYPSSLIAWNLYLQTALGNHDIALDILEKGVKNKKGQFINFRNDPFLLPLHNHPKFRHLVDNTFHPSRLPDGRIVKSENKVDRPLIPEPEMAESSLSIITLLQKEKLFLDPNLSLKILAKKMDLHPNKLSWILNEHVGKNFNEFINSFRLETFKSKALDPKNKHLTLLGLAYESGFNSKTAFNAFFKKTEGKTPRAWVKSMESDKQP